MREVSRAVAARGWLLLELSRESLSLEEIFLRLVHIGDAERDKGGRAA